MKVKIFLLGIVLTVLVYGRAPAQDIKLGLEGGANLSEFVGPSITSDFKLGLVAGGFINFDLGTVFSLKPELLYEQKGSAFGNGSTEEDFIEIPILLKLSLGSPTVNPSILLGPAFSFNILARYNSGGISRVALGANDVDIVGGIEVDFDKFLISGRYELGLISYVPNVSVTNGTITFLVGYSLI